MPRAPLDTDRPPRLDGVRSLFADADFRNYWYASAIFGLGVWVFITTMGWAALELTDSAFAVSLVNVTYFLPMFLFAIPAGVLGDIWDRRHVAILARGGCGAAMVIMAVMAATGRLTFPWLATFSFIVGLSVIVELAARQAFIAQLVSDTHLVNATALTSIQGGMSRAVGPLLAGWLIASIGDSASYSVFAAANLLFVWWFLRIRTPGKVARTTLSPPMREIVDGLRYLRGHRDALSIVLLRVLTGVVGWIYLALLPLVARDVLGGDAVTLGTLGMAVGLGALPGPTMLSITRGLRREGTLFVVSLLTWGTGIVALSFSRSLALSVMALVVAGTGYGALGILTRTLLLRVVEPAFHGRVLSTVMLTHGATVVGTLAGGSVAELWGVAPVIGLSGALIVAITLTLVAWNPRLVRL